MSKRKRTVGLIAFLKGSSNPEDRMPGCANFDHHYGGCLYEKTCKVEQGKRCGYFEKAVLPVAAELGLQNVYEAYEDLTGAEMLKRPQARLCPDCGGPVRLRQRYCDNCAHKRRKASYRKRRAKQVV